MSKLDEIRIIVIGDSGVGKTSIIMSLVSESYTELVPSVLHTVTVPPDMTPHHIQLTISDTSSKISFEQLYKQYIQLYYSNHNHITTGLGIVVVCSADVNNSIDHVINYYIPQLDKFCPDIPIVIAINKSSTTQSNINNLKLFDSLLNSYRVFNIIECSAKHIYKISDIFWSVQTAVIAPLSPLIDTATLRLKSMYIKSLYRIYQLYCNDQHLIDTNSLNNYQLTVYKRPLQINAMHDILELLSAQQTGATLLHDTQLTFDGWCEMHKHIILNKRTDTIWYALQCFGYNRLLQLDDSYVKLSEFKSNNYTIEFSEYGIQYLIDIFNKNVPCKQLTIQSTNTSNNHNDTTQMNALQRIFKASPEIPFALQSTQYIQTYMNSTNDIDVYGWLSHWNILLTYNTTLALKQLLYIGLNILPTITQSFIESTHNALRKCITILPSRINDNKRHTSVNRHVVSCLIASSPQCDKSLFIASMLNKQSLQSPPSTPLHGSVNHNNSTNSTTINTRIYAQSLHAIQHKSMSSDSNILSDELPMNYIIIKALASQHTKSLLKQEYHKHDILLLLYDNTLSASYQYVQELLVAACHLHIPTLVICITNNTTNIMTQLISDYTQSTYSVKFIAFDSKQYYTDSICKQMYSNELICYPIEQQSINIYNYIYNCGTINSFKYVPANKLLQQKQRQRIMWLIITGSIITFVSISAILLQRHMNNQPLINKQWIHKIRSQLKR